MKFKFKRVYHSGESLRTTDEGVVNEALSVVVIEDFPKFVDIVIWQADSGKGRWIVEAMSGELKGMVLSIFDKEDQAIQDATKRIKMYWNSSSLMFDKIQERDSEYPKWVKAQEEWEQKEIEKEEKKRKEKQKYA